MFQADLSATSLLAELESVSAQLSSAVEATPIGQALPVALAEPGDNTGMMQAVNTGMFHTQASDKQLIKQAVISRRKAAKAERAAEKAERKLNRATRLRALQRAVARASRRATDGAAAAADDFVSSNRGGHAGPGPLSALAAASQRRATAAAADAATSAAMSLAKPSLPGSSAHMIKATARKRIMAGRAPVEPYAAAAPIAPVPLAAPAARVVAVAAPAAAAPSSPLPVVMSPVRQGAAHERRQRGAARGRTTQGSLRGASGAPPPPLLAPAPRHSAAPAGEAGLSGPGSRGAVSDYFKQASRSDLLSAEQERGLYLMVRQHSSIEEAGRRLAARLGRPPTDAEWAEEVGAPSADGFRAARFAAAAAKQLMVDSNMRLVVAICKRYQNLGISLSDLISEGVAGLIRGVEKFDGSKGFKFSTYAHWWIRQGVTRALTDQGRLVRLPAHVQELLGRIQRTSKKMEGDLRRKPSNAELAAVMGVPEAKLEEAFGALQAVRSLDSPSGGSDGYTLGDTVEDESAGGADGSSVEAGLREDVAALLRRLPAREAAILSMRFGLEGEPLKLDQVGAKLKITRERVRQIEAKALRHLRTSMGEMEGSIIEYGEAPAAGGLRLAARTSSGTKKS